MIQDIFPKKFNNQFFNILANQDDYVFIFKGHGKQDDSVLISSCEQSIELPKLRELNISNNKLIYLFSIDSEKFFLYMDCLDCSNQEKIEDDLENLLISPQKYSFNPIRIFRTNNPGYICMAGATAYHLYCWYRDSKFCGRCGTPTIPDTKIRMVQCPKCSTMFFPKIAPAIIVGVRNNDQILISRYKGREYSGIALLAGFCEIGETPEETVEREVFEEVGLKVKNITYFGSQPWGFDLNLLLGYFADLDGSDEINLDREELSTAKFVKRDELEKNENPISLTATMIEAFRTGKY